MSFLCKKLIARRNEILGQLERAKAEYAALSQKHITLVAERDKLSYERFGYQGKAIELAEELGDEKVTTAFLVGRLRLLGSELLTSQVCRDCVDIAWKRDYKRMRAWRNAFYVLLVLFIGIGVLAVWLAGRGA
jgi:hypothetical protein